MAIRPNLDVLIANSTGLKKAFGESYKLKKHLERPMNIDIFGESFGILKTEPKRMQNERMLIKANAIHLIQQGESDNTIKEKLKTWGDTVKTAVIKAWQFLVENIVQLVRKVIGIRANARRTVKAIDTVLKRNITQTAAKEVKLYTFSNENNIKKQQDGQAVTGAARYLSNRVTALEDKIKKAEKGNIDAKDLYTDEKMKSLRDDVKKEVVAQETTAKTLTPDQAKALLRAEKNILRVTEGMCDKMEKVQQTARTTLKNVKKLFTDKKAAEQSKTNDEDEAMAASRKERFMNTRKLAHQVSQEITAVAGATTAYFSAHITNAGRLMKVLKGGSEKVKTEKKDKKENKKEGKK